MRAVVQRVGPASVIVGDETVGSIDHGLAVFLGVAPGDDDASADRLASRVATLRIFRDSAGRMNLDVGQVGGEALVVSQFTLFADASRGHRPSFLGAAPPEQAESLYLRFVDRLRRLGLTVATGRFGAHMRVQLVNDGPVTMVLTSAEGPWPADAG